MNIYAANGTKVTVTKESIEAGYPSDSLEAKKYLRVGGVYTVNQTVVGGFHTTVYIKEVPLVGFNSVNFEDYIEENNASFI